MPAHSFNLVKNKEIFDKKTTLSDTGAFSNYILKLDGTIRQDHPYSSSAAIGKKPNIYAIIILRMFMER